MPLNPLYLYGDRLYPASSVLTSSPVAADGTFTFASVPLLEYGFQFRKPGARQALQTKKLHFAAPGVYKVALTPPGQHDGERVSGCFGPLWSPDSQWLVCRYQRKPGPSGTSEEARRETWVARADGAELLKAFDGHPSVVWLPDSQALAFVEDGQLLRFPLEAMAPPFRRASACSSPSSGP